MRRNLRDINLSGSQHIFLFIYFFLLEKSWDESQTVFQGLRKALNWVLNFNWLAQWRPGWHDSLFWFTIWVLFCVCVSLSEERTRQQAIISRTCGRRSSLSHALLFSSPFLWAIPPYGFFLWSASLTRLSGRIWSSLAHGELQKAGLPLRSWKEGVRPPLKGWCPGPRSSQRVGTVLTGFSWVSDV